MLKFKNILYGLFCFSLLILLISCSHECEISDKTISEFNDYLNDQIPGWIDYYNIPGVAVGLIQNGKPVWSKAYGYINREQTAPVTTDTYYRAESMTKSITAWAVMILAEQEKINLNHPVEDYLNRWEFPDSAFDTNGVTIRRLLSHSAGMTFSIFSDFEMDDTADPQKKILNQLAEKQAIIEKEPGKEFIYSNPGYVVLELLIEEVSGETYIDFVKENILRPLGMHQSGFTLTPEIKNNSVTGYLFDGQPVPLNPEPIYAHGGLFTTVDDFLLFVAAGIRDNPDGLKILSSQFINMMHSSELKTQGFYALGTDSIGLGHFIEDGGNSHNLVSHGGQGAGWIAWYYIIPESGDGIVMFTNSEVSWRLITHILNSWSAWLEISPPKLSSTFSKITAVLWSFIVISVLITLFYTSRILYHLRTGQRTFKVFSPGLIKKQILGFISGFLLLILAWHMSQIYLIAGMFPVISKWLTVALKFLGVVILCNFLLPKNTNGENNDIYESTPLKLTGKTASTDN